MLTCEINGGNPIATLSWQCVGFTPVTPTGILPTDKVVSSIEKIVTKEDNGKNCTCTGQHRLWTPDQKISFHILHVYCKYYEQKYDKVQYMAYMYYSPIFPDRILHVYINIAY